MAATTAALLATADPARADSGHAAAKRRLACFTDMVQRANVRLE